MSQRISLSEDDFKVLCRGEIVTQGGLQCALQDDIGHPQMFNALVDALHETASSLVSDGQVPIVAFTFREDEEEIRRWIYGINQGEPCAPGGFLHSFAQTLCRADDTNYPLLRPALLILKAKFPKYRFSGVL